MGPYVAGLLRHVSFIRGQVTDGAIEFVTHARYRLAANKQECEYQPVEVGDKQSQTWSLWLAPLTLFPGKNAKCLGENLER